MRERNQTQLNCFSPPVMIATMVTEVALAVYTIWRYKMTPTVRLATVTLLALGGFQLSEYFVCTGSVGHAIEWSRIGFAEITLLPPLGLHLMHSVAGKPRRRELRYFPLAATRRRRLLGVLHGLDCYGRLVRHALGQ